MSKTPTPNALRALYDEYPTPRRDPQDERRRLVIRPMERLAQINHFVFGGRQGFGPGSRILAAGAGVGDEVLYLAEQLRDRGGSIVHLDSSRAAQDLCAARVAARGLDNVAFHHGLIEELDPDEIGVFDYVHCFDVLTQLPDPHLGLQRLAGVLKSDGGMGLLARAPVGVSGDLMVGQLARTLAAEGLDLKSLHHVGLAVLAALPPEHPFFRAVPRDQALSDMAEDPGMLLERLLTPAGAGLTIGLLYELVESCGLKVIEFVASDAAQPLFTLLYDPDFYVTDPALSRKLAGMTTRARRELAELLNGAMGAHGFYCGPLGVREALPTDEAMIPSLTFVPSCYVTKNNRLLVTDYEGRLFEFDANPSIQLIFHLIDGERTIGEIVAEGNRLMQQVGLPAVDLLPPFLQLFSNLRNFGWVTLRHKSVTAFARYDHLYFAAAGWVSMKSAF